LWAPPSRFIRFPMKIGNPQCNISRYFEVFVLPIVPRPDSRPYLHRLFLIFLHCWSMFFTSLSCTWHVGYFWCCFPVYV
jgi:hypothetical protein